MAAQGTCEIEASQAGNSNYGAAQSVTQSFNVVPAPNFSLTPNPSAETVPRGNLAAFILNLKSLNGFSGNVKLSCSSGPAGSYCVDFPMTVHLNGTARAVSGILFPKNTKPGTYTITFTGVSGSLTNSTHATFTVK
jgi:aminopeptidase S